MQVVVGLDLSSPTSISLPLVHALGLPCIFTESGHQTCSIALIVPTVDGYFCSRLDFAVGYGLFADVILGIDWRVPCQPIPLNDHDATLQSPTPHLLDSLTPPHFWYPVAGLFLSLHLLRTLTVLSDLSRKLHGSDVRARDALSSSITECCRNDAFCFVLFNDHEIALDASCDEQQAIVLAHIFNRECASAPSTPSCKLFTRGASSTFHLSPVFCSLLLASYRNKLNITLDDFTLSCTSVGLYPTTVSPGNSKIIVTTLSCQRGLSRDVGV